MVPFDDDPVSMEIVNDTYPAAGADGSYSYEKTVSLKALKRHSPRNSQVSSLISIGVWSSCTGSRHQRSFLRRSLPWTTSRRR